MATDDQIRRMQTIIEQQEKRIQEKDATIAVLRKLVDELQSLKASLEETLEEFRRQFFGVQSEKIKPDKSKQDADKEILKTIEVKSHTRQRKPKATREELYANLPIREVLIPLTDEERHCAYCSSEMKTIGYTSVREELRITPAKVERILYKREVAVCSECKKDGDGTLIKAAVPTALFPHSPASSSIVAYVMYHKIFVGTPYYRQEAGMFQLGLKLPRETMENWFIKVVELYFLPVFEKLHEKLLQRDLIHTDETTCQVLREEDRPVETTFYMWIYLSGNDGLPARQGRKVCAAISGWFYRNAAVRWLSGIQ